MTRRKTRPVRVRDVVIGGDAPITVQSMTNADTRDLAATNAQIQALAAAGCDIARVAVFDEKSARNVRDIVDQSPIPVVADIHFDYRLAIAAVENGIDKLRINPGNIGDAGRVKRVCDCLRAHRVPVRVGVNLGSAERDIEAEYGPTAEALVHSALRHIKVLEKNNISDIIISLKASDIAIMMEANRRIAAMCDYPLHMGVTEAGLPGIGEIKSAIGIGGLLLEGIGDTLRVSLTGDPVPEIAAGQRILTALGLKPGVNIISCPTCGRCRIDVRRIAEEVRAKTADIDTNIQVAVMGCVVNGPGEAKHADIGIAGGDGKGVLFTKDGQETLDMERAAARLIEGVRAIGAARKKRDSGE